MKHCDNFLKISDSDISWNEYHLVYKGVQLPLTRENISDYQMQTGMSAKDLIEYTYNNSLSVLRDKKLKDLLDD